MSMQREQNVRVYRHRHFSPARNARTHERARTGELGASETERAQCARQQRGRVLGENEERARVGGAVKHVGGRTGGDARGSYDAGRADATKSQSSDV